MVRWMLVKIFSDILGPSTNRYNSFVGLLNISHLKSRVSVGYIRPATGRSWPYVLFMLVIRTGGEWVATVDSGSGQCSVFEDRRYRWPADTWSWWTHSTGLRVVVLYMYFRLPVVIRQAPVLVLGWRVAVMILWWYKRAYMWLMIEPNGRPIYSRWASAT